MVNTKNNRRSQNSKQRIQAAYLAMINTTPDQRVKVIDLCKRAQLNRSTFYAHYYDADQVGEELLAQMTADLATVLADQRDVAHMLAQVLQLIKDHQNFYRYYFVTTKTANVLNILDSHVMAQATEPFIQRFSNLDEFEYHRDFFNAGMAAIITRWLLNDCQTPMATILKILREKIQNV